jgi:hypothetical protein
VPQAVASESDEQRLPHLLKPDWQVNVQPPETHAATALVTDVEQTLHALPQ